MLSKRDREEFSKFIGWSDCLRGYAWIGDPGNEVYIKPETIVAIEPSEDTSGECRLKGVGFEVKVNASSRYMSVALAYLSTVTLK